MTKSAQPLLVVALLLLLAACTGESTRTPTPTPSPVPSPTPTATATPTITPGVISVTETPTPDRSSQGRLGVVALLAAQIIAIEEGVAPGTGLAVFGDEAFARRMAGNSVSMHFDGRFVGNMVCLATLCRGNFTVPQDASLGEHMLEAGGVTITIMVVSQAPIPTQVSQVPFAIGITVEPASPRVGDVVTVRATVTGASSVIRIGLRPAELLGMCGEPLPFECNEYVLTVDRPGYTRSSPPFEWTLRARKPGEVKIVVWVEYYPEGPVRFLRDAESEPATIRVSE